MRGLLGAVAIVTVLVVAGCGEDTRSASVDPTPTDSSSSPAQDLSFEEVCDRVEEIYPAGDELPTQDELDEIREDLRALGDQAEPVNSTPVAAALMKLPPLEAVDPSEFDEGRAAIAELCDPQGSPPAQALPPYDEWVRTVDEKSSVTFRFPAGVEPNRRSQPVGDQTVETRVYQTGEPIAVSVGLSEIPQGMAAPPPRDTFSRIQSGLSAAGADDVTVSSLRNTELQGRPAVEGVIRFTAKDGFKNYWRITVLQLGDAQLSLQTISFSPPAQAAKVAPQVDSLHRQLVAGVRLPG